MDFNKSKEGFDGLILFWDTDLGTWAVNVDDKDPMTVAQVCELVRLGLLAVA